MSHLQSDRIDKVEFKFSAGETEKGTFTGYGSIFGNTDSHGDVVEPGAFQESLRDWQQKGKFPKMLLQHGGGMFGGAATDGLPIGKWTSVEENSKGLKVSGFIDPIDTDEGKKIYAGLRNGELDGLSIGYKAKKFVLGTKAGEPRRKLQAVDLFEISIVTFPSNPKTMISAVKSRLAALTVEEKRDLDTILRTKGLSRSDAAKAVSGVNEWLLRDAADQETEHRDDVPGLKSLLASIQSMRANLSNR